MIARAVSITVTAEHDADVRAKTDRLARGVCAFDGCEHQLVREGDWMRCPHCRFSWRLLGSIEEPAYECRWQYADGPSPTRMSDLR